jgi:Protein of unknown function (DUF1353)
MLRQYLLWLMLLSAGGCATIPAETVRMFADGNDSILIEPLSYRIKDSNFVITVPAGFVTDYASVPGSLHSILGRHGKYGRAAIVHDYLYWDQSCTRTQADKLLWLAMIESNVSTLQSNTIFWAVAGFGASSWEQNQAERLEGKPRIIPPEYRRIPDTAVWPKYREQLFKKGVRAEPFSSPPTIQPYCSAADVYVIDPPPSDERPEHE